jgi:hypothetical protein
LRGARRASQAAGWRGVMLDIDLDKLDLRLPHA